MAVIVFPVADPLVRNQVDEVNLRNLRELVVGLPTLSASAKVKLGLYEVIPVTPLLDSVHLRLIYLVWLRPDCDDGSAAVVDTSRYPFPDGVPVQEIENGAKLLVSPTGKSPVVVVLATYLRNVPMTYPAPVLEAVPFNPTIT